MARSIDRRHPREAKVPHQVGVKEWGDEATRRSVDVQRNVRAVVAVEPVQCRGQGRDRLVAAVEGRPEDADHPDGVVVAALDRLRRGEVMAISCERHLARFDVEVAAELLPADLHVDSHDDVRAVVGKSGGPTARLPAPLQGQTAKHRGLARSGGRGAHRALIV